MSCFCVLFIQESQFCIVPAGTDGIYRTGQCIGTNNPLVSYQKKYQSYLLHIGCTGKIRLFWSINGYRAETQKVSFVRKENREEGEKEEDNDEVGVALWSNYFFFFFFLFSFSSSSSSLSICPSPSLFFFFFFFSAGSVHLPLLFYFCWTLLCMVWFLTFSFFVLYLFLKFPKLSTWLSTLTLAAKALEI